MIGGAADFKAEDISLRMEPVTVCVEVFVCVCVCVLA